MKVPNKLVRWEHEPWTVVTLGMANHPQDGYYAFNTRTGERKPVRKTWKEAYTDIPGQGPHAEPWGV